MNRQTERGEESLQARVHDFYPFANEYHPLDTNTLAAPGNFKVLLAGPCFLKTRLHVLTDTQIGLMSEGGSTWEMPAIPSCPIFCRLFEAARIRGLICY